MHACMDAVVRGSRRHQPNDAAIASPPDVVARLTGAKYKIAEGLWQSQRGVMLQLQLMRRMQAASDAMRLGGCRKQNLNRDSNKAGSAGGGTYRDP